MHLTAEQRAAAPVLRRALLAARTRWEAGERSADALRDAMRETLTAEPLADVDYVSVADGTTLAELERSTARRCCRWRSVSGPRASSTTSCSSPIRAA